MLKKFGFDLQPFDGMYLKDLESQVPAKYDTIYFVSHSGELNDNNINFKF